MALTPAQKYRQEKLAKLQAEKAKAAGGDPHGAPQGSEYELMMAALAEHKRNLAGIKADELKAEYKARAVKDFDSWVDGVLAAGQGGADPLFMEMLVWNMDAGNYERTLAMAKYAIQHKLSMPDQFNRAVPEFLMDAFSEKYYSNSLGEQAAALLANVIEVTTGVDAHDQPRAKLFKAHAFASLGCRPTSAEFKEHKFDVEVGKAALEELQRAFALDEKAGVKKDIERLEAALSNMEKTSPE